MRRPTERRWLPWLNGVSWTTSYSHRQRPRSWWWITGDRAEYIHPSPSTRHLWSGVNSYKFLCVHITEDLTWSAHTDAVLKKAHQWLFFLRRLRKFGTSSSILRSFYLHCGEHPDRLHHRLVWKQHRWQPQSSANGRANCPATLLDVSFPPFRTSTPGGAWGKPGGSSKTPATRPTVCSRCFPQEDVSAASDPTLANWGIAIRLMNSQK